MKPYYDDGTCVIYHGDCREVVPWLPRLAMRISCVIADPPYQQTSLDWDRWPDGWPRVLAEALTEPLSLWCFGSLRMFMERAVEFTDWRLAQDVVWQKHNGSSFHADRFRRVHESVAHFYRGSWDALHKVPVFTHDARKKEVRRKERPAHAGEIANSTYRSEDGGPRLALSVLQVRSEHGRALHPTQKPEGIIEPLLDYSLPFTGAVLDPFMGSGTTLRAAKNRGRRAVGIEIDERYCEIAARRLGQEVLAL